MKPKLKVLAIALVLPLILIVLAGLNRSQGTLFDVMSYISMYALDALASYLYSADERE